MQKEYFNYVRPLIEPYVCMYRIKNKKQNLEIKITAFNEITISLYVNPYIFRI